MDLLDNLRLDQGRIANIKRYYFIMQKLCTNDPLIGWSTSYNIDMILRTIPDSYREAIRNKWCFDIYRDYIVYMAEQTYGRQGSLDFSYPISLLKRDRSKSFRDMYENECENAACLARSFNDFIRDHVKYHSGSMGIGYELAEYGLYWASSIMADKLGCFLDGERVITELKERVDKLLIKYESETEHE